MPPRICTEVTKHCQRCGLAYHPRSDKVATSRFCSAGCRSSGVAVELNADQAGAKNRNWRGGISADAVHYARIQAERYPERIAARRAVLDALKRGKLTRRPCEVCGSTRVQAHHDDYSKPLNVNWLCRVHHSERHHGLATGREQRTEAA